MALEITPPLDDAAREALHAALERAGVSLEPRPAAYVSVWRRVASREAVDSGLVAQRYARSPRSTRGATRA